MPYLPMDFQSEVYLFSLPFSYSFILSSLIILLNAVSTALILGLSNGYRVVYLFTTTLCFILGRTTPNNPRNSVVCARCLSSSDVPSEVLILFGAKTSFAVDIVLRAFTKIPVASTVSASNDIGITAMSAD